MEISDTDFLVDLMQYEYLSSSKKEEEVSSLDQRIETLANEIFDEPRQMGGSVGIKGGYSEDKGPYVEVDARYEWSAI